MISAVPDILSRIVEHKRAELRDLKFPTEPIENNTRRGFANALTAAPPAIIAEVKKASPSKGVLAQEFDPVQIARTYQAGGAAALSVLTDQHFFQGSIDHLKAARASVQLPVLRKDFTIHRDQIAEAAAAGADAILLIAAILTEAELGDFREYAETFGMDALVEVHDRPELDRTIASGARVIGVNNRDLRTFQVKLKVSLDLANHMPQGAILVSESGIGTPEDVRQLRAAGYSAFLVGEHLMRAPDPAAALRELRS